MEKKKYAGKPLRVAVVGATGLVGQEMVRLLEERGFPVEELWLYASERSVGEALVYRDQDVPVHALSETSFKEHPVDLGLFSPGKKVSAVYAPLAVRSGAMVVDNTSCFRMEADVPLVVPEVNPEEIAAYRNRGIIANPNCSTIQMVLPLKALHDRYGLKRVVVSTYQSVSGAGRRAIDALSKQTIGLLTQQEPPIEVFPYRIAFNCIPHIDDFTPSGYTLEEMKMINETRKIMKLPNLKITATTVRVPVFFGHSESVNVELERPFDLENVRAELSRFSGVEVVDDPGKLQYPLASEAAEKNEVFVGRLRRDDSCENGLNMWVVSDNIRKGAALNAIQIAEKWITEYRA